MSATKATPSTPRATDRHDIIIVGAGLSGLLLAARLAHALPTASIAVLEKEAQLGGRLCGNVPHLWQVSRGLLDCCVQTCALAGKTAPQELFAPYQHRQIELVVATAKTLNIAHHELFSTAIVQQLGGRVLASVAEKLCAETQGGRLKKIVKNFDQPLATLLDKLAVMLALPNISTLTVKQLQQKLAAQRTDELLSAAWQQILPLLTKNNNIVVKTECQVISAQREHRSWQLQSAQGTHRSQALVVAHPPWNAGEWLAAQYWPAQLLRSVRKSKPHSAVCLVTTPIAVAADMPRELCVAAANTHVLRTSRGELALAQVLSYETQLRAPAVTAAVGKLKRALHILTRIYQSAAELRLIALVPAAYCLPLGEAQATATGLFFCGDSCGKNENGDDNIITTVQNVSEALVNFLQNGSDGTSKNN